jgi:KDO2-lipid IV(A) lauroyltransferase
MKRTLRQRAERWRAAWGAAPSARQALLDLLLYLAVRLWATAIGCFPVETNLRTARALGWLWWTLHPRSRVRALENLRAAYGPEVSEARLRAIGRACCQHFAQVYLVEAVLSPRLINAWSWPRYVELDDLGPALRTLLNGRGALLLTPHFGNYELLGYTLARVGIPLHAIMRPLDNPLLNDFIVESRADSGLKLLFKKGVTEAADAVVANGGALCFIADQDAGRKGVFADFFGRKASWYKSIGLLAMSRQAPVIVGYAARARRGRMRYRVHVSRIIEPPEWQDRPDPLQWITAQFAAAMEDGVRRHPEQYLWVHRRWKTRPKSERHADAPL